MKKGYLQSALTLLLILCMVGFLASCGPGGGSGNIDDPNGTEEPSGDDGGTAATPKKISLATSQVSVKSDNSDSATITATVLDKDNAIIEGATVSFSADGGQISAASVDTDANGRAPILFSSGTIEKNNRVVTITAKVGKLPAVQIPISVTGTTISMATGKTNLELDPESPDKAEATLTITVKDAGLQPIYDAELTVSIDSTSTGDATLTPLTGYEDYKTDLSGQIKVQVTGTEAGSVVVKAAALGATATQAYTVGGVGEVFAIIDPAEDVVSLATDEPLTIIVAAPGSSDYNVAFATTLGAWDGGSEQVVIKAREDGQASAVLRSSEAGLATIQVYREDDISVTDSITVAISAPSSQAAKIALQASATVVQPSTEGVNNTVTLIATVKNASDQVVGGAPVAFSIEDTTGGGEFVAPVVVLTNASGRAESTFTSGSLSSDAAGVTVRARVVGAPGVQPSSIAIVIGGTAGSIGIGRGTTVASISNDTAYSLPMSVLVSDTNGNAAPGATVSLKIWPLNYATGYWVPQSPPASDCAPVFTGIFLNEDKNKNLILDPGEDINKDGKLTPHSSAAGSLPSVVVTDENGVANFNLVYLKTSAAWIDAEITASTFVQGTETQASYTFTMPWLDSDSKGCLLPSSPYNTAPEAELLVEAVPTVISANGTSTSEIRVLVRDSKHNPINGGDVYFTTDLGTISSVAITDTAGYAILGTDGSGNRVWPTLTSERQNGIATVTVQFGEFEKTVQVAFTGVSISVTANPESLPTDSSATITATLKDAAGDPLAGQQIIMTKTLGNFAPGPQGGTVSDGEFIATTNTEGRVTALLTSSIGGIAEVTAYHGPTKGTAVETKATTQVSFSGVELTITPEAASLVADGVSTTNVEFELKEEGVPIAGQTLILSTTLGTIDYTVITDATGKATATLKSGTVVGVATITATANLGGGNNIGGSIEFNMTSGVVDSIDILVDPPVISADTGTSDISVTVRDANGNPVGGAQVAFTIISGPGGGETITPARITTPGPGSATPGQVTSIFKAGSLGSKTPKDVHIQVRAGDEDFFVTSTADLTIVGKPAHIALGICTVFDRCVINNEDGTFSLPVAAVVSDVNGISVPGGYLVYFSTNTPEVGALISPVATDDTGRASTILIFPQTALGTLLTITAETTGVSQDFEFEIPFQDDEIAAVHLSVPGTMLADGIQQVGMTAQAVLGDGTYALAASLFETNALPEFTGNSVGNISGVYYNLLGETIGYLTADPSPDDYTIWVRATATEVHSNLQAVKAKGITVDVKSANNAVVANGQSTTTVTATVKETTSKKPVADAPINFGVDIGTIEGAAFTDGSGTATTTFTSVASSQDLTATVYVYYGPGLSDSTQIHLVAFPEVASLYVSATRTTLYAKNTETSDITVQVVNANGNPVPDGQEVTFYITSGPGQIPVVAYTTNGLATVTYTASPDPGTAVIEISSGGVTKTLNIFVIQPPIGGVGNVQLSFSVVQDPAEEPQLIADGQHATLVTATVTDLLGNPIADNTNVIFTTTGGDIDSQTPGDQTSFAAQTANGTAVAILRSSTIPGQYVVSGTAGGISQLASIRFVPGSAWEIILTANPYVIKPAGQQPDTSDITAVVLDQQGNIVADGTAVTFQTLVGNLTDPTKVGDIQLPTKSTVTLQGVAKVVLHAPADNDLATVTAQAGGVSNSVNVIIGIGPGTGEPVFIEITAQPDSIQVKGTGGDESAWIQAAVRDAQGFPYDDSKIGNPKDNIRFEILTGPGGGEVLDAGADGRGTSVTTSTTGGIAAVALNSGTIPGTVRIRVFVLKDTDGNLLAAPVEAISTPIGIEAGGPFSITIYKDEGITNNADGTYSWTISAMVRDQYGNPVADETGVYFGLVDNPILGYKSMGTDGATTAGSNVFTSASTAFLGDGVEDMDTLIIREGQNEGGYVIDQPADGSLTLFYNLSETESNLDFVAGNAELGEICGYGETGGAIPNVLCVPALVPAIKGVARSRLTWSLDARGFPFCIYAETAGRDLGDTLCDVYRSIEDVKIDVVIIPSDITADMADGITIQAHFYDAADNDLVGRTLTFRTSNSAVTGFGAVGTATTTAVTNLNGRATVENLLIADCREGDSTTITVSSGDTFSTEVILSFEGNLPEANFSSQSSGLSVQFSDLSSTTEGTITGWSWNFGDGSPGSNEQNPTHDYPSAGVYSVTLTATNSLGCDSSPISESVSVQIAPPTADFIYNDEGNADEVSFVDTSETPVGTTLTQWNWTFVGGSPATSIGQTPPVVSFGGAGTHPVILTVTNDVGGTDTTNVLVTVAPLTPSVPTADFSYNDQGNADEVAFIDSSTTPAGTNLTQWDWTFVTTSTTETWSGQTPPVISFGGAGTYPVSLTVTNNTGGTNTYSEFVNVAVLPKPTASFLSSATGINPHEMAFVDTSTTPAGTTIITRSWDFDNDGVEDSALPGDTNTFAAAGIYPVALTVTNDVGGTDTVAILVNVP
jgi:PKD repeat protein